MKNKKNIFHLVSVEMHMYTQILGLYKLYRKIDQNYDFDSPTLKL